MKILVISNLYPPEFLGGYELGCAQAVKALRLRGHEVLVCTTPTHLASRPEADVSRNLELADVYRPVALRSDCRLLDEVKGKCINFHNVSVVLDTIAGFQPDIVYLWNLLGLGVVGIVSVLNHLELPWVWHLMDRIPTALSELPAGLDSLFAESSSRDLSKGTFIALSEVLGDECATYGINLGQNVFVVPNWVTSQHSLASRSIRSDGPLRCISVGTLGDHKGTSLIVEGAKLLIDAGHSNFFVDFYGPGDPEPYRVQAHKYGIHEHLRFHGPRDQTELERLYFDHDLLLFPTWYREPGGFVAFEAAASGCVPLITELCGAAEWLVGDVHAVKIERSAKGLAEALVRILRGDIDLEAISRRAAWAVRTGFDLSKTILQIERILKEASREFMIEEGRWRNARTIYRLLDKMSIQTTLS